MRKMISFLTLVFVPILSFGQLTQSINNFDSAPADSNFWKYEISENADSTKSFINLSYDTESIEGAGSMKLEWGAHNIESWGGYSKLYHYVREPLPPDTTSGPDGPGGPVVHDGPPVVFSGTFGGSVYDSTANTYTKPTGSEGWAGFANEDTTFYPFSFPGGGTITFMASAAADADVHFKFEYNPHPDTEPSYTTSSVTISGTTPTHYSVDIPPQGANTYSSFLFYVETADVAVTMTHVHVHTGVVFSGTFGGTVFDSTANTYTKPAGSEGWAGFANEDASLYPLSFPDGGSITFMGSAAADASVYFRFEANPHPNTEPSYNTVNVAISGATPTHYSVDIPPSANTYNSFLVYVVEEDVAVTMTQIHTHKFGPAPMMVENLNSFSNDQWTSSFNNDMQIESMSREHGELLDWSKYDSISFSYNNLIAPSEAVRVHLRLNISDYANKDHDYVGLGEYYYSFNYILDDAPGWNTVTIPLKSSPGTEGQGGAEGFWLTGWAGDLDADVVDGSVISTHAIGGYHFEFSINGAGDDANTTDVDESDFMTGTILLDDLKLTGYKSQEIVLFNGQSYPPSMSPFSWNGATLSVTEDAGYIQGTNALTYVQGDNAWTGAGFNISPPVDLAGAGEWLTDTLSFWMHSEVDAPELRLQFEAGTGKVGKNFTPVAAGGWNHYKVALKDFAYVDGTAGLDTANISVFQVMGEGNGLAGRTFHFDNMWTGNPDIDVVAPSAPATVSGIPSTGNYFNLVTWQDVDGEEGEVYHVYASRNPIDSVNAEGVEIVATNLIEGVQTAAHTLVAPLQDVSVSYYYAVVCVDAAGNVGTPGLSEDINGNHISVTNTAKGIPTISLDVPSDFVADGDLSEWTNSGIMPFIIKPENGGVWASVDNEADLTGTVYLAIDDDYLYFAADVVDDDYHFGNGNWWDQDALQLFFGLYDSRGPKHSSISRGDEPDYIVYANENTLQLDNPTNSSIGNSDQDHYHFEMFDPDYVTEGRISLDTLALKGGDPRFYPQNGMKIPLDIYFHDNDNGTWEGNVGYSTNANDQQWNNPGEWSFTWIGDQSTVLGNDEELVITPEVFALYQNYPNPFNPVTNIKFSLPENQKVNLSIYSVTGRLVETLVNENKVAGFHKIKWNASRHASGVYFYRLDAGVNSKTQKMILLK